MASLLDSLAAATGPKTNAKARKETSSVTVEGLQVYGALAKVAKEIESINKTSPVRELSLQRFVDGGISLGKMPDSFPGHEGKTTASIQPRKKDSRSALDADVVARCTDLGITLEHLVIVPGAVIVNPAYMDQTASLEKLLAMARKAGFPDDFFQMQTEVSREIAAADSLDDVCALAKAKKISPLVARELIESLISLTIVPKFNGTLSEAMVIVGTELLGSRPDTAETKPKAAKLVTPSLLDVMKASLAEVEPVTETRNPGRKRRA